MSGTEPLIERARATDADAVCSLLEQNALPTAGLREHLATTLVARQAGRVVGSAALEVYADGALLRSVAVAGDLQRHGLGAQLTDAALRLARELRVPAVFLLTTTAEHYFPRFGFARVTRADVPPSLLQSVEFTSACPATAIVMCRRM
jgi:amino-acid N-acetyltransferase